VACVGTNTVEVWRASHDQSFENFTKRRPQDAKESNNFVNSHRIFDYRFYLDGRAFEERRTLPKSLGIDADTNTATQESDGSETVADDESDRSDPVADGNADTGKSFRSGTESDAD